jgi:hypothetical protein
LLSPRVSTAGAGISSSSSLAALRALGPLRGDPDRGVGRESRLEQALPVLDLDLDAEDKLDPVLLGLDVLGRELGFGRDEGDPAGKGAAGEGVDPDVRGVPEPDASDLQLGEVDHDIDAVEIGNCHDG